MSEVKPEKYANRVKATAAVGKATEAYYQKCWKDAEKGAITAWGEGIAYFPLIRAAGVNYIFADAMSARMGAKKFNHAKPAAADFGFLDESCSYSRYHIGAARILKGDYTIDGDWDLTKIMAPMPDVYFNTDCCSAGNTWGDLLHRYLDIPAYTVYTRRVYEKDAWSDERAHVEDQLKEMVKYIETLTGEPYDWNKLHDLMVILKESAAKRTRMRELMALKPAPMTYFDVLSTFSCFTILHGLPEAPQLLQGVIDECEDRVAKGITGIKEEKYRIWWIGAMYWARLGYMAEKMAKMGVNVVGGTYDYMFFPFPEEVDPDKPLETLSYAPISCGYTTDNNTAPAMTDWRIAKDLDIDGIIVWEAHTCRLQSGTNHDRADYLAQRLGVPVTYVSGDFVDDSFFNEAQFDTRVQGLLEVIDARRAAKKEIEANGV